MKRPINQDRLGQKGEDRFSELCADLGLIRNKSTDDRTGWDFIVEFPFAEKLAGTSLDARPAPMSFRVQVKTRWAAGSRRVDMTLSAAERLAKEPKPSLLVVFDVNEDLSFARAQIIHVRGKFLARILKRLRVEHGRNSDKINNKKLNFCPEDYGVEFDINGESFGKVLIETIGTDLEAYIASKHAELTTLGYGHDRFSGTLTFMARDEAHLIDVFLGLEPVEVKNFSVVETRFGIPLPHSNTSPSDELILTIEQEPKSCQIIVKKSLRNPILYFQAELIGSPINLCSSDSSKILVRAKLWDVIIQPGKFEWRSKPEVIGTARLPVLEFWKFFKFLEYSTTAGGSIDISTDNSASLLSGGFSNEVDGNKIATFNWFAMAFDAAVRVFKALGISDQTFLYSEIRDSIPQIEFLDAFLHTPDILSNLSFHAPASLAVPTDNLEDVLFVNVVEFAGLCIGIAAVVSFKITVDGEATHWASDKFQPIAARVLSLPRDDYERFLEDAKREFPARHGLIMGSLNCS